MAYLFKVQERIIQISFQPNYLYKKINSYIFVHWVYSVVQLGENCQIKCNKDLGIIDSPYQKTKFKHMISKPEVKAYRKCWQPLLPKTREETQTHN